MQHGVEQMGAIAQQKGACPRCHGYMVPLIPDGSEEILLGPCESFGFRCVNCGERIDPLIVTNRRASNK